MNNDVKAVVIEALERVLDGKYPESFQRGLCGNIYNKVGAMFGWSVALRTEDKMKALYQQWPEFSGDTDFPVPAPASFESEFNDFDYYHSLAEECYWTTPHKYEGEYGRARLRLANWCIEQLKGDMV